MHFSQLLTHIILEGEYVCWKHKKSKNEYVKKMLNRLNSKYFSIWSDKYLDWRCWTLSHMNLKHLISWSPNAYASCSHLCLLITWQTHFSLYIFKTLTLHVHQMHIFFFFWRFYHCWFFLKKMLSQSISCIANYTHK